MSVLVDDEWIDAHKPAIYDSMLKTAQTVADRYQISRGVQDEYALQSQMRTAAGQQAGAFDEEIVPVKIPQRKGDPIEFRDDEGIRADTTVESLARLKPAFAKDGTITAGNRRSSSSLAASSRC